MYVIILHTGADSRYGSESSDLWLAVMALLGQESAAVGTSVSAALSGVSL